MSSNQDLNKNSIQPHDANHLDEGIKENVTETLIRQVDTMIQREMSGNNELGPMVSYSKLYCLAST